jgi:hypothetical protein
LKMAKLRPSCSLTRFPLTLPTSGCGILVRFWAAKACYTLCFQIKSLARKWTGGSSYKTARFWDSNRKYWPILKPSELQGVISKCSVR